MAEHFEYNSLERLHPGEMISEYLDAFEWSQRELARRTGISTKTVSELCNGKANVNASTALALELVFARPASFWLNLQRRYDEYLARNARQNLEEEWAQWANKFPVAELRKFGWLKPEEGESNAESLLKYFGVSSPDTWSEVWDAAGVAYRQTRRFETNEESISSWVRAVELLAAGVSTESFSERTLKSHLPNLRTLTKLRPENFLPRLQELCASAGVAVVFAPGLKKTGISGCTKWVSKNKVIVGLTLRYKSDDQVWFTFFHEIGHVLLHRAKHSFILDNADENLTDEVVDPQLRQIEDEANQFALDTLVPAADLAGFIRKGDFTENAILGFASEIEVAPGIVVGRLQAEKILEYYQGQSLKQMFDWRLAESE